MTVPAVAVDLIAGMAVITAGFGAAVVAVVLCALAAAADRHDAQARRERIAAAAFERKQREQIHG